MYSTKCWLFRIEIKFSLNLVISQEINQLYVKQFITLIWYIFGVNVELNNKCTLWDEYTQYANFQVGL